MKKIHLACSKEPLREPLRYIKFTSEKAIATDAHIAVVMDINDVMPNVLSPGEELFILAEDWKFTRAYDAIGFRRNGDQIVVIWRSGRSSIIQIKQTDFKYPDIEAVLPSKFETSLNGIGINGKMYLTLLDVIGCKAAILKFSEQNKAVRVDPIGWSSSSPVLAIIMSCAIPIAR